MFAKIKAERINFIRFNQTKLRTEEYIHLKDAIRDDKDTSDIGQLIILPSSFTGGMRYMHERKQDAMTYVRGHGRPDLFITFTCNPKWPEISTQLMHGQKSQDRHDLLARVFRRKVVIIMELIVKGSIFGKTRCYMYTLEWQKRGLPHTHILICGWLTKSRQTKYTTLSVLNCQTLLLTRHSSTLPPRTSSTDSVVTSRQTLHVWWTTTVRRTSKSTSYTRHRQTTMATHCTGDASRAKASSKLISSYAASKSL